MLDRFVEWYADGGMVEENARNAGWWTSFAALIFAAVVLHFVVTFIIVRAVRAAVRRLGFKAPETVLDGGVLRWVAHMTPAIFIHRAAPGFLGQGHALAEVLHTLTLIYLLLSGVLALFSLINGFVRLYEQRPLAREVPATSFVQVIKLVIALIALVLGVSVIIGRSPLIIFSGLGAMTAILLLVFKDAILGFVAGIQLAANRMIAVGDWVEMPKYGADGDVEEVALTTVKVRNWDRTRTTIPTYALISDSFKNWRGMQEAGGRRIKRALHIDTQSIRLLDDDLHARLHEIRLLQPYFEAKDRELEQWYREQGYASRDDAGINGRKLTNVGTYRAYAEAYLRHHPKIHQNMTLLVRHLDPGAHGLPIEFYCFTNDIRWGAYESIQADIFDHLIAMARVFDLAIHQSPASSDIRLLATRER
ncbi:MAG TPA: mechanosensitive ion channel family protein [Luteolibacter sp.]|nr:mechanosensitive ion channel family protein [Luteolibacter sp.]